MTRQTHKPILIESVQAQIDLLQNRFVGFDGNYCKAGAKAFGVTEAEAEAEQFSPIAVLGTLIVETGASVSQGAVMSDENGKAVPHVTDKECNGYALDTASAAGEFIRIVRGI